METLYIVVPCYNEQEVLYETAMRLKDKLKSLIENGQVSGKSKIMFVDDGSIDSTWHIISQLHETDDVFSGVKLSCNKGHQNALLAGLMTAKDLCDISISMDADLQDDINAIDSFLKKRNDGCDIVYGVRSHRKNDSFFKKTTASGFYKFMSLLGADIVHDHADYRLMSKRALEGLEGFREANLFLRGIVRLIGYKSGIVYYERNERFAGQSKYPLRKMLGFAMEGITSFSVRPIRAVTTLGFLIFAVSLIMLLYFFIIKLMGKTVEGWATIVGSVWFIGGLQLLSLGIIGEYIGKIYNEVKNRPKFIIEEILDKQKTP